MFRNKGRKRFRPLLFLVIKQNPNVPLGTKYW